MESELNVIITKANELLLTIPDKNDTKRKILISRAKKSLIAFEFVMKKLIH